VKVEEPVGDAVFIVKDDYTKMKAGEYCEYTVSSLTGGSRSNPLVAAYMDWYTKQSKGLKVKIEKWSGNRLVIIVDTIYGDGKMKSSHLAVLLLKSYSIELNQSMNYLKIRSLMILMLMDNSEVTGILTKSCTVSVVHYTLRRLIS